MWTRPWSAGAQKHMDCIITCGSYRPLPRPPAKISNRAPVGHTADDERGGGGVQPMRE